MTPRLFGGVDSRSVVCLLTMYVSLLTSMCIGKFMYYVQPLQVHRYVHIPRYVHVPEQTYLIHKFIKFRGCLEAASKRTNVPFSSAGTWTPFHHPRLFQ